MDGGVGGKLPPKTILTPSIPGVSRMKITVKKGTLADAKADVVVVGVFARAKKLEGVAAAVDRRLRGSVLATLEFGDFDGKVGEAAWVSPHRMSAKRVLVVGLGAEKDFDGAAVRRAAATAASWCRKAKLRSLAVAPFIGKAVDTQTAACCMAEGFGRANYDPAIHVTLREHKRPPQLNRVQFIVAADEVEAVEAGAHRGEALAAGVNFSRDLVNEPSNILTPTVMAKRAKAMAAQYDTITCKVWGPKEIEKHGMGGLIGVGQGSAEPSQFIQLEYKPKQAKGKLKSIAFVGKGLTFDTGGISIKPASGMELMKFDMGGAAAVLGAFHILGALRPQVRVLGFIAAAENMPDGKAIKPGDVLYMMNGMTVEVNNTDAEGRLVLADAIHYAKEQKPEFIVDAATLTGACVVALGDVACGLMSEDDRLVALIEGASKDSGDRVWRLPLEETHREVMKGHVGDLINTGPREGGALNAAGFLSYFAKGCRWAHLDIAGTVWAERDRDDNPKGATGFGARLFAAIAEAAANE